MDKLLKHQIKHYLGAHYQGEEIFKKEFFKDFIKAIDDTYQSHRKELAALEKAVELNTRELYEANLRLQAQNEAITKLATTDPLTGLPNRLVCHDRINQALKRVKRQKGEFSLLFIDLDRFKVINDTLGHHFGDQLLRKVAKRLIKCVRESDTVARLGGDEFTVLLEDISRDYVPSAIAEKILKALAKPYLINDRELNITASIGIGIYPANGDSVVEIFKNADTAMYCVKENGRNNFMAYDRWMNDKAIEMMDMENYLRKALDAGEFSLLYQPKLNVATGKIVALEALLRWENPVLGCIPPDRFIPLAESTGLIHPIGAWVIHEVCRQNREWQQQGLKPVEVAVNISSLQIADARFIESIDQALIDSGMQTRYLELEITESTIMRSDKIVMDNIAKLKERGLMLSIDDFGTGYSSLSVIKQFPIDSLKIDQSFVRDIDNDPDDEAIVTTIIAMARNLKLSVIAEGVETAEQMQCLINKGCDLIQGYWVSRPLDARGVEALLSRDPDFFSDNYDQRSQFRH